MRPIIILSALVVLTACQHMLVEDIHAIETAKTDPSCVRECSTAYSNCIGGAFGISAQNACGNGYKLCIGTCPTK